MRPRLTDLDRLDRQVVALQAELGHTAGQLVAANHRAARLRRWLTLALVGLTLACAALLIGGTPCP